MCLCLLNVFRRRAVFKLLTPKFTEATEKSVFGEKRPLTKKNQNFATKGFMRTLIHTFLSRFAEIGEAEVTKRVRGIHHENGWYFARFYGAISPKILQVFFFPRFPSLYHVFVQNRPVFEEIYPKMCSRLITISARSLKRV